MNRAERSRRRGAAIARTAAVEAEEAARRRVERLEQAAREGCTRSLNVSHAAAVRALEGLPPPCLRLVWGMVSVHALRGGGDRDFREAARLMGDATMTWRLFERLHRVGLLTINERGAHVLHPLFGSVAHRLNEIGRGVLDGDHGSGAAIFRVAPAVHGTPREAAG